MLMVMPLLNNTPANKIYHVLVAFIAQQGQRASSMRKVQNGTLSMS